MASKEQQTVLISFKDTVRDGQLFFTAFTRNDRIKRAVLALVICLALGIPLIFPIIPILHIFLAAGLFIAGPVLFYKRLHQHDAKEKVTGACPNCAHDISIELEANEQLPLWKYCPQCNESLQISAKAD